jgi:2'-5' RNA ligase
MKGQRITRPALRAPGEAWRVFLAIELPAPVRLKLIEHIDRLRDLIPDVQVSWLREDNLHLTLKFLGDIPVVSLEAVAQAAQRAANTVAPFEVLVSGCGAFPPRGQPRVLWVGIKDPSGQLTSLHSALEDECASAGLPREPRQYHPHLTIARIRKPHQARNLATVHQETGFDAPAVLAADLVIVRSELRSEGARHTIISRHAFSSLKIE